MTSSILPLFPFLISLILLPFNIVVNGKCHYVFDVVQIQDVTRTVDRFWPTMKSQVGLIMKKIADSDSGSRFGLASFQDKNIKGVNPTTSQPHMLGNRTDYCVRLDAKLSKPNAEKITKVFQKYGARKDGGGGDTKESVFEALYRVLLTPKMGWRSKTKVAKLAVIVTNGVSHVVGDVPALTGKEVRPFDITLEGLKKNKDNVNYDCDKVDYPSVQQVVELVKQERAQVVVLAAPCGKFDSEGQFTPCQDLAALGDEYKKPDGLATWYHKQFLDANLNNVLLYELDSKMENYAEVFDKVIDDAVETIQNYEDDFYEYVVDLPNHVHRSLHGLDHQQLTEVLKETQELESYLNQESDELEERCFSDDKKRHDLVYLISDALYEVRRFKRSVDSELASKKNEGKEQQD